MLTWADCEWQNVELHAMAQDSMISGSLTAQKRSSSSEDTGFVFIDCKITGTGQVYLGRAWGPYSRTVYINTYMENIIIPEGWQDWGSSQRQK
jgi:pectinesterase